MGRQLTSHIRRGRHRTSEAKAFRSLLHVLQSKKSTRSREATETYCSSATISRTAWEWVEKGTLQDLWQKHLDGLPVGEVTQWLRVFEYYRESWKKRGLANRWAGRVHTKWFKLMDSVLSEKARQYARKPRSARRSSADDQPDSK